METTFGIPMNEPTKKHEGYEDFMVRKMREEQANLQSDNIDMVNQPPHYNQGDIEAIDAIQASLGTEGFMAYCRGNVLKYVWRCEYKGGIKDIEKARWYLDKLIDTMRTKAEHMYPEKRGRR